MSAGPSEARSPIATLEFEESGNATRLKFTFASGDEVPDVVFHDLEPIKAAWQRAGTHLKRLVWNSARRASTAEDLRQPLARLLDAGTLLGQRLAGEDAHRWGQIREAFTRSWPTWENASRDDIPVVQLIGYRTTFPVELLPVFSNEVLHHLDNDAELAIAAQRMLGFSAIVRRVAPGVDPTADLLNNSQKLPIQFVRFRAPKRLFGKRSTTGFDRETAFMASLSDVVSIDGPWPKSDVSANDVQDRLVASLFDPASPLSEPGSPPAELAHFACHCDTEDRDAEEYELTFSDENGRELSISLGDIQVGYDRLVRTEIAPQKRAPIILNACGTSSVDPWSALSFHRWFLVNRHRAFVGTQVAIPDDVAADFAERFYLFLLGGYTFGEAIVLARRQLLADARSLLGILYILFGNDLLSVSVEHRRYLPATLA